jgi:hypothetical protein
MSTGLKSAGTAGMTVGGGACTTKATGTGLGAGVASVPGAATVAAGAAAVSAVGFLSLDFLGGAIVVMVVVLFLVRVG